MKKQPRLFARFLFGSGLACLALPFAATAQDSDDDDRLALEEIVVTAEKIESTAQETSRAISVIDSDELIITNATSLQDALYNIPGFGYGGGDDQPFMRGIGLDQSTDVVQPAVAVNIDGAGSFGGATMSGGTPGTNSGISNALFDVARVEVIRGPSGTMVGQNALAGSVNVVTRRPTLGEWGFNTSVSAGNYGTRSLNLGADIPIGDTFGLRLAYARSERTECYGKVTNGTDTVCQEDFEDRDQARIRGMWQPNDKFSVMATADYSQDNSRTGRLAGDPDASDPWLSLQNLPPCPPFCGPPPELTDGRKGKDPGSKNYRYSVEIAYDSERFGTFKLLPTYSVSEPYFSGVLPGFCAPNGPVPIGSGPCIIPQDETRKTAEVQWNSAPGKKLEWLAGALIDKQQVNSNWTRGGGIAANVNPPTNRFNPSVAFVMAQYALDNPGGAIPALIDGDRSFPPRNTKSAYLNLTYNITDDLRLTAGARYAEDNTGGTYEFLAWGYGFATGVTADTSEWWFTNVNSPEWDTYSVYDEQNPVIGLPTLADFPGTSPGDWSCVYPTSCDFIFITDPSQYKAASQPINYNVGFEYDVADSSMVYFNWNTGYQAGGVEIFYNPAKTYPPQEVDQYAIGSKNRFLDNRLEFNIEIYKADYTNWNAFSDNFGAVPFTLGSTDYVQPDISLYVGNGTTSNPTSQSLPYPDQLSMGGKPRRITVDMAHWGLEADMRALITADDMISANLSLMHHVFPEYEDGFGVSYYGQALANAPAISARLSYTHTFHVMGGSLEPRVDMRWVTDAYVTNARGTPFGPTDPASIIQKEFHKYDAYVNYTHDGGHISASLYGRNLKNTAEKLSAGFGGTRITEPRTYGLTVSYNY